MNTLSCSAVLTLSLVMTSCAQDSTRATLHVTDDLGNPVTNATVRASTFLRLDPGSEAGIRVSDYREGKTDASGLVTITLPSRGGDVGYLVVPVPGGFHMNQRILLGDGREYYYGSGADVRFTNRVAGRWQPWNPTVEVQVKPVLKPIPMYAKWCSGELDKPCKTPELGKAFGFDLMASDWVSPHGKGKVADFLIRVDAVPSKMPPDFYQKNPKAKYRMDSTLSISFSGSDDGIQSVMAPPYKGSALRLPRLAPEAGYQTNYTVKYYFNGTRTIDETDQPDRNYFFRVRSKRDENGKLVEALYGKIHGPIEFDSDGLVKFLYYLNPTPMDRNLEFDPEKNLLKDLSFLEQPKEP